MKYLQIAGLMLNRIKVDKSNGIDKIFAPGLDIEKMEAQDVSGFDFILPIQIFEKFYQAGDIEAEILENLSTRDDVIIVPGGSGITTGLYWIKNELVRIFQVDVGSTDTLFVFRGQHKTFAQKYTRNERTGQFYFIRKYPKAFVGQRVFIWEDDKLLSIGIITAQPVYNATTISFNCENAISCLDVPWSIPSGASFLASVVDDSEESEAIATSLLNQSLNFNTNSLFEFEVPPILDYMEISTKANITTTASNKTYIKIEDLDNILDYLKLYGKLNASVFTWNNTREAYTFMSISDISSLDSVSSINLSKYLNTKSNYESSAYSGISQITIKLRNNVVSVNNVNTSQFSQKSILEIDLSKFIGIKSEDVTDISFFYTRLFSVIYSKLTIPTHELVFEHFAEGKFYDISDIDKFQTFQNVSNRAFCLSKDEKNVIFLVTRTVVKNPISPAMPVTASTTSVLLHGNDMNEYIETNKETIKDAVIMDYNHLFFAVGDNVVFVRENGTKLAGLIINSINNSGGIDFTGTPFVIGEKGYITYNAFAACTLRQKKFFFLNINEW